MIMDTNKLVEHLLTKCHLTEDDFLSGTAFYYMAGRFPNLTIAQCADAVQIIRNKIISSL